MAWADDARCLFCDGKLPLFRKLAQGQFCSKQHEEAYWKEQNQLAVEVLHRTHDAIQSFKAAVPIEDILGPTAAPPAAAVNPLPAPEPEFLPLDHPHADLRSFINTHPDLDPRHPTSPPSVSSMLDRLREADHGSTGRKDPTKPKVQEYTPSWIRPQETEYSFSYKLPAPEGLVEKVRKAENQAEPLERSAEELRDDHDGSSKQLPASAYSLGSDFDLAQMQARLAEASDPLPSALPAVEWDDPDFAAESDRLAAFKRVQGSTLDESSDDFVLPESEEWLAEPEAQPAAEREPAFASMLAMHFELEPVNFRGEGADSPLTALEFETAPELGFLARGTVTSEDVPDMAGLVAPAGMGWHTAHFTEIRVGEPVQYEARPLVEKPNQELLGSVASDLNFEPIELAEQIAMPQPQVAVLEMAGAEAELEFEDGPLEVISPGLPQGLAPSLPEGARVDFSVGDFKRLDAPQLVIEPIAAAAPQLSFVSLRHDLNPCGDVLEQMEREAFPLSETLFALDGPALAAPLAAQRMENAEFRQMAPAAAEIPAARWSQQLCALAGSEEVFTLSVDFEPYDWQVLIEVEPVACEPSLEQREHVHGRGLMFPRAAMGIDSDPAMAGLQRLPQMVEAADDAAAHAHRLVSFQPFAYNGQVARPEGQIIVEEQVLSPNLVTRTFRLKMENRVTPRNCTLPSRGALVPSFEPGEPTLPRPRFEIRDWNARSGSAAAAAAIAGFTRNLTGGVAHFWNHAPRDLKIMLFAVPVAVALAFHPSLPKVSTKAPEAATTEVSSFSNVVNNGMASMRKAMADRAAVGLDENFRHGLDSWQAIDGSTAEWAFDQAGFVMPGRVALYKPSLGLKDYEMQFLGAVDKGALSWVLRASDFQNFYVVKLAVLSNGPVPKLGLTRYAVIDGKAVDRVDLPVPIDARRDSLYRVGMTVEGGHYALTIQGRVIDSWEEPRLKHGGVGFFTNRGEQSRIGWLQITHQYDMLGRLFAYLAP